MKIIDLLLSISILLGSGLNSIMGKEGGIISYSQELLRKSGLYSSFGLEKFVLEGEKFNNFDIYDSLYDFGFDEGNGTFKNEEEEGDLGEEFKDYIEEKGDLGEDFSYDFNTEENYDFNKDNFQGTEEYREDFTPFDENILRIVLDKYPSSWNKKLYLDECNYEESKNYEDTYGYLIGTNLRTLGSLRGDYTFNSVMLLGAEVKYPNIFALDEAYGLENKEAISLRSEDEKLRFVLNSTENTTNMTLDDFYKEEVLGKEIVKCNLGENRLEYYVRRGEHAYYKVISLEEGRISYFIYEFPKEYGDLLLPMMEESKNSFKVFKGYPNSLEEIEK